MKRAFYPLFVLAALFPVAADAHYLWIEESCADNGCEVDVFYGEYDEGVRESKSTRLNERSGTRAWSAAGEALTPLPLEMLDDRLHVASNITASAGVVAKDEEGAVMDLSKHGIGIVRPIFYARSAGNGTDSAKPAQALDLDVLPAGEEAFRPGRRTSLQVLFRNTPPAASVDVKIYGPNGWNVKVPSSESGQVAFTPPAPGLYVAEVIVREEQPGSFKGKNFEAIRHRATLSMDVIG